MVPQLAKNLTLAISASLLLIGCGGGSNNSVAEPTPPTDENQSPNPMQPLPEQPPITTNNQLDFPITEFRIKAIDIGLVDNLYFIKENYQAKMNGTLSEQISTLYAQDPQRDVNWNINREYILTQDKLYTASDSQHPRYIVTQASGKLVLAFDADHTGLKSTVTFKNISLDQVAFNSSYVTTALLNDSSDFRKHDANWQKMLQKITGNSGVFSKDSICYQYLTQQYDRPNIGFGKFSYTSEKTLDAWVKQQQALGHKVVKASWAGYPVAYVPNSQESSFYVGIGYRTLAAVMLDGQLYQGQYDAGKVYNLHEEYNNLAQFNKGICDAYNQTAAQKLRTSFLNLPKN
jgi:hypothetical protein